MTFIMGWQFRTVFTWWTQSSHWRNIGLLSFVSVLPRPWPHLAIQKWSFWNYFHRSQRFRPPVCHFVAKVEPLLFDQDLEALERSAHVHFVLFWTKHAIKMHDTHNSAWFGGKRFERKVFQRWETKEQRVWARQGQDQRRRECEQRTRVIDKGFS